MAAKQKSGLPIVEIPFDGPYEARANDGHVIASGRYKNGLRHGMWRIDGSGKRTYVEGVAEEAPVEPSAEPDPEPRNGIAMEHWPNGALQSSAPYVDDRIHGELLRYFDDGRPEYQGSFVYDHPVGLHRAWDDDGSLTETTYVNGLDAKVAGDTKLFVRAKKAYDKAKHSKLYALKDVIRNSAPDAKVDRVIFQMWRTDHLGFGDEEVRIAIGDVAELVTAADLFRMFEQYDFATEARAWPLPHWPAELDRIAMTVYAHEPRPIDRAWKAQPGPVKLGLAYVLARHGKDVGTLLSKRLRTITLANTRPQTVYLPDTQVGPRTVELGNEQADECQADFATIRGLFGSDAQWVKHLEYALDHEDTSYGQSAGTYQVWLEHAPLRSLAKHVGNIGEIDWAKLATRRADDARTLAELIALIDDEQARAELAPHALLAHHAEHLTAPDHVVDAVRLETCSPWLPRASGELRAIVKQRDPAVEQTFRSQELLHRAMQTLPEARVTSILERSETQASQFLYLVHDPAVLERLVRRIADDPAVRPEEMVGIGEAGGRVIELLIAQLARAKGAKKKRLVRIAILAALARMTVDDGGFAEDYDDHIQFELAAQPETGGYLDRVVCGLPRARLEKVMLRAFESPATFAGAFARIGACATAPVLRAGYAKLLAYQGNVRRQSTTIADGIAALPDHDNWWWTLHAGGATSWLKEECERQLSIGKFAD